MWNENDGQWVYQCWRYSQLDGLKNKDNNGVMTTKKNEDWEQNHQRGKHSQPD